MGLSCPVARAFAQTPLALTLALFAAGCLLAAAGSARAQEEAEPSSVRFMAYNVRNYLSEPQTPKPESEIAALVQIIAAEAPDLLGVCEMGDEPEVRDLQRRLKNAGVDLPEMEWVRAASQESRNLALLSRFPLIARRSQRSLTYRLGDSLLPMQRGILDVEVALSPTQRLRLVGLHLKSQVEVPEGDQALMRRNEAALARAHVESILREDPASNLLVYGDLNDTVNEMPVRALLGRRGSESYLDALDAADRQGHRWTHYWKAADEYARFDFLLVSKALKKNLPPFDARIVDGPEWLTASDHRPLVVSLRIGKK